MAKQTKEERDNFVKEIWDGSDLNNDGKLTQAEFAAFYKTQSDKIAAKYGWVPVLNEEDVTKTFEALDKLSPAE